MIADFGIAETASVPSLNSLNSTAAKSTCVEEGAVKRGAESAENPGTRDAALAMRPSERNLAHEESFM